MTQTKAELLQTRHQGDIRLGDADSTHYVGFKAPATVGTSLVWTLPAVDGTANYLLKTDGSGNLGWVADSSTDSTKMPLAGGTFTGNTLYNDGVRAQFGTGNDLNIYHTSNINHIEVPNAATGDLKIETLGAKSIHLRAGDNSTGAHDSIICNSNGSVHLFYDNVKTFQTDANGIWVLGPEGGHAEVVLFADEGDDNADKWRLQTDTSGNFKISNYSTGSWVNGLTLDGSNNATFADDVYLKDGKKLILGDDSDINIKHQSGQFELNNTTGNTYFNANGQFSLRCNSSGSVETYLFGNPGGSIDLYYANVKKYETTSAGSKFTGGVSQVATAMGALEVDCNTSNYFTKTISGNSTFTFANPAASGQATAFTLELTHSSGTVTWPSSVKWNADTAPTLTTGKTHLFMFVTDDGGTRWRGSALVDYVN